MDENIKQQLNSLIGKEIHIITKGMFFEFRPLKDVTFLKKQDIYPYESVSLSTGIPLNGDTKAFVRICIYDTVKMENNKIIFNGGLISEVQIIFKIGEC